MLLMGRLVPALSVVLPLAGIVTAYVLSGFVTACVLKVDGLLDTAVWLLSLVVVSLSVGLPCVVNTATSLILSRQF